MTAAKFGVRSLPLRVAPISGEALDSWMETVAARHRAPFGDVLTRYGLTTVGVPISTWLRSLTGEQTNRIADVSGVDPQIIAAMTMARFTGCFADPGEAPPVSGVQWVCQAGSRMCRGCLDDTDGRWQLEWRLNWFFACVHHRCLLSERCPLCDRPQRRHPHPLPVIPQPGRCAQSCQRCAARPPQVCMARLTAGEVVSLADAPQALQAQRCIDELLAGRTPYLGVYGRSPPTPPRVLGDIHVIARWIVSSVKYEALAHHLAGMASPVQVQRRDLTRVRRAANPSVQQAAAGIIVALKVFAQSSVSSAVSLLCDLMTEVDRGVDVYRAPIPENIWLSPVARAVHDAAAFRQVIWPQRSARILAPSVLAGLFASGGGFAGA
jgi:hypothetical protein